MNLTLLRTEYRADGILGVLTNSGGSAETEMYLSLFVLEHAYFDAALTNDRAYMAKLPAGTYNCIRGTHQLEHGDPFETFEVTGVPGHSGILFHVGNHNEDSNGCILLGKSKDPSTTAILQSRIAFAELMRAQAGVDTFTLTVLDAKT